MTDTRLDYLRRAWSRLYNANEAPRIGWVRWMELRDAASALQCAGEQVLGRTAFAAADDDDDISGLLQRVRELIDQEEAK